MKILKIAWIGGHQKQREGLFTSMHVQDTGDYGLCVQNLSINQSNPTS